MEKETNQKNITPILKSRKMILIGSFYNLWDEEYIARTFEGLGWEVKRFEAEDTSPDDVLREIETNPYSFLLTVNRRIKGDFSELLGRIKTVFWLFDLYFGTFREKDIHINPRFNCDYVFTTDGGHQQEFFWSRVNHYVLRQGIYEEDAYVGENIKELYPADIVFVGTLSPGIHLWRGSMIKNLQFTYGKRFKWWGKSGPNEIRGKRLNDLYATSKIVVGDSAPSPEYWSVRAYEVLGRGGFLIHPMTEGLDKEFKYYKHFVPFEYRNFEELKSQIEYYLIHDKEREKIRKAGFEYCKKQHHFKGRCEQLLKIINET